MKLFEYMGKELLSSYGIRIPKGNTASTVDEAFQAAYEINAPVVVKSQILSGKRGKGGGIAFASTPQEAKKAAEEILYSTVQGLTVKKVLVEEKLKINQELYVAITVDSSAGKPLLIISAQGGIDIEEVPDNEIVKYHIDTFIGLNNYASRDITRRIGLTGNAAKEMTLLLPKLYKLFREKDAELVEINPLVVSDNNLIAADAKITIDDESVFRQPELPYVEERTEAEQKAHDAGLSYVQLDGNIAVMANGAGITMGTLDTLEYYGGKPANFMDAGGGTGMEGTVKALEILLDAKPKVIFINIFGGITRCDDVANALVKVKKEVGIPIPVVIRLVGTNEEAGVKILKDNGFQAYKLMHQAAAKAVEIANRIK